MIGVNTIAIKVCGMRDHQNIAQVAAFEPQYLGFIFYEKSPRFVGNDFVLPRELPSSIKKVGVFVNENNRVILDKTRLLGLDFIQLHGNESPGQALQLKSEGLKIIKAFSIDNEFDFATTQPYREAVNFFLFDTKGKYFGGNAKTFNWNVLENYDQQMPFFLSGGLSAENVRDVQRLSKLNIHALDLNSGVEDRPGLKSITKLRALLDELHGTSDESININT
ncbi:MAG TPA: phosphoribosylanthranilate isomerase [Chryseolinea sp.]|nr:phosphoribosylanthranilate isomerase [Chryseolinea sp.]